MKPISIEAVDSLRYAKQNFCDCYLVSSISALAHSTNGRKILQKNIQQDRDAFCIRFNNVNGHPEQYLVKQKECSDLILYDKYMEPVYLEKPHHPIIKAIEVAMNKLLKDHPDKRSIWNYFLDVQEKFEYNRPSRFLSMFTGIRPITLNEYGLKMNLKDMRTPAIDLLKNIAKNSEFSFVAGTGFKGPLSDLPHCYSVSKVDADEQTLQMFDCRRQRTRILDFDETVKSIKYFCGYFNDMLK